MKGYYTDLEKETTTNENFRKVLYTGKFSQLVLMSLQPNEEIGMEVHHDNDQFFRFEQGQGRAVIDDTKYDIKPGIAVLVPAGAQHNILNTSSSEELKFYTIYAPPHHKDGIKRMTKQEAEDNSVEFDGETTE